MGKHSSITVKEFLASNPYYVRLTIDGLLMYDDDTGWNGIYETCRYQDKKISSAYIDVVHFHHYEISITTVENIEKKFEES